MVTSSSGNHGLACIDAMKKWVPLFPSSNACLSSFEYAHFRYGLKGRIIVPRMVSDAKRKNLFLSSLNCKTKGERCQAEEARAGGRRPAPPRQRLCGDRDARQVLHNIRSASPFRKRTGWSTYFYFTSFFHESCH